MPKHTSDPSFTSAAILAQWTLNPVQQAFLASEARFSFYVGGVGAGKTTAGALRAIAYALDHPGALGLIGAPTYPMLRDTTQRAFFALLGEPGDPLPNPSPVRGRGASRAHADLPSPGVSRGRVAEPGEAGRGSALSYSYHKVEGHLRLENGSEILFRSADQPDRMRGLTLAWFWLDEAPLCGYYAWQVLKGRLRQEGYATQGWATGTPKGRDGFARDFELHPRPSHALYRAATTANAAHLPQDYIDDLGLSGALYDQEVLGLFTAFSGLVYAFSADATDGHIHEPEEGKRFARVIGGVDWGSTNPTAAVIFGLDGDDRAWQLDEWYERRAPLDAVVLPALVDLTRTYGVETWYCGPDEPEHIAALQTALARAGLSSRALPAEDAVRPGIQTVTRLLGRRGDGTRGLYVAPRCVHTIAEYGMYQYPAQTLSPYPLPDAGRGTEATTLAFGSGSGSGSPSPLGGGGWGEGAAGPASELPLKQYDHLMDATRYALHTALGRSRATDAWVELYLTRRGQ